MWMSYAATSAEGSAVRFSDVPFIDCSRCPASIIFSAFCASVGVIPALIALDKGFAIGVGGFCTRLRPATAAETCAIRASAPVDPSWPNVPYRTALHSRPSEGDIKRKSNAVTKFSTLSRHRRQLSIIDFGDGFWGFSTPSHPHHSECVRPSPSRGAVPSIAQQDERRVDVVDRNWVRFLPPPGSALLRGSMNLLPTPEPESSLIRGVAKGPAVVRLSSLGTAAAKRNRTIHSQRWHEPDDSC
jgi:hypothetical protein